MENKFPFEWLFGYSGLTLYFALISCFGVTGYYSDLFQKFIPTWVALFIFVFPIGAIIFVQWGELSPKIVAYVHIIAVSIMTLFSLGMEVGSYLGYKPEGTLFYKVVAHLGWTFAWGSILSKASFIVRLRNK